MTELAQRIEALLLVAGEALTMADVAEATGCPVANVPRYLAEVTEALANHGICVVTTQDTVQLTTSPSVSSWLTTAWPAEADELTPAAAETLALIAYRGPIARVALDAIRGVDSRRMVRQLLARDLIRVVDRTAAVSQYVVTEVFLRQAGVTKVQELPVFDTLSSDAKITDLLSATGV